MVAEARDLLSSLPVTVLFILGRGASRVSPSDSPVTVRLGY